MGKCASKKQRRYTYEEDFTHNKDSDDANASKSAFAEENAVKVEEDIVKIEGMKKLVGKWKAIKNENNKDMKKILKHLGVPGGLLPAAMTMKETIEIAHVSGMTFQEQVNDVKKRPWENYTLSIPYTKENGLSKKTMQLHSDFHDGKHCAEILHDGNTMHVQRWVENENDQEKLVIFFSIKGGEVTTKRFYKRVK